MEKAKAVAISEDWLNESNKQRNQVATEIEVLKVQNKAINEKVDNLKSELKENIHEIHEKIETESSSILAAIDKVVNINLVASDKIAVANSNAIAKLETSTNNAIDKLANSSKQAHEALNDKISALEKWRWIVTGGVAVSSALGFHTIMKIFGM